MTDEAAGLRALSGRLGNVDAAGRWQMPPGVWGVIAPKPPPGRVNCTLRLGPEFTGVRHRDRIVTLSPEGAVLLDGEPTGQTVPVNALVHISITGDQVTVTEVPR